MQVVSNNNQTKINPLITVLIFCLAATTAGRVIETPTLRDNRVMDIRAGRKTEITVPAYNFQKIYQRSVLKEVDGQYVPYDQCQTNPGEVELDIDDTLVFEDRQKLILTDSFEDMYLMFLTQKIFPVPARHLL